MGLTGEVTHARRPGEHATRSTPPGSPASSSGWLTASDSISHGLFAPGALLDGRYRIIGLLGRGGMGEVYRADDLRLGQPVALKFLPEGLRRDPVRLAQFHNEVRTARQVSHPNVCRVYDIGEADGLLYLSMEYVHGEDLASSLRRMGRFPEDKATEIARQLCAGLAAAHQRGVVHRDLKPANVMLDDAGQVRVMDFGLAAAGRVEDIGAGTPAYMAPEQLLGREVTARSDIFALGLVLYEIFTGRRAFTAATIGDLVGQHESGALTPPSTVVATLDAAVERAILRCLEPDPERRPPSALAVAAAFPGADPLAAALAAGETPSPEMVAAAGRGESLPRAAAWLLLALVVAGLTASYVMAASRSPVSALGPEFPRDVLVQKARDAIAQAGYPQRPRDEAYGFAWDSRLVQYVERSDGGAPRWREVLAQRPSPLTFWYRRSDDVLTGTTFHTDLLTPGIVNGEDPPPITSGMIRADLDHRGRLTYFEAIPPQRLDAPVHAAPVDWAPLFALAELDAAALQPAEPLWNWLAASDTRAAWTGVWPGSGRPLRVEAAALGGRPVAFMLTGPWQTPSRMPEAADDDSTGYLALLIVFAATILVGATVLARRNVKDGRGDRRGAARLGIAMAVVLMALWISRVHAVASIGLAGQFLLAVCTSVFYGVLLWTIYLALEPFVRRHWPQALVSWTALLSGRVTDPIVGRDVLIGVAVGLWFTLAIRGIAVWLGGASLISFPGDVEVLLGMRPTGGVVLEEALYAIRNVLLYFLILVVLRVLLRRRWAAAIAWTGFFTLLNALGDDRRWVGALVGAVYFGTAAAVIVRWGGLLAFVVGTFVSSLLFDVIATPDTSAWYFGNIMLLVAIPLALACWGLYAALGGFAGGMFAPRRS